MARCAPARVAILTEKAEWALSRCGLPVTVRHPNGNRYLVAYTYCCMREPKHEGKCDPYVEYPGTVGFSRGDDRPEMGGDSLAR